VSVNRAAANLFTELKYLGWYILAGYQHQQLGLHGDIQISF